MSGGYGGNGGRSQERTSVCGYRGDDGLPQRRWVAMVMIVMVKSDGDGCGHVVKE